MVENSTGIRMEETYFGPLWKYVSDDNIIDIDFNGSDLWIRTADTKRKKIEAHGLTRIFIEQFSNRIANEVSLPFNQVSCVLEAETETLRLEFVHEAVTTTGRAFCIRKSLPYVRYTAEDLLKDGFTEKRALAFLLNCIRAGANIVIIGEPGVGKTEFFKFLSQYIRPEDKVINVEDKPELHYSRINPGNDCIEIKVTKNMTRKDAIVASLRLNPSWLNLSEARSVEIMNVIEGWSTGVHGITTCHGYDVREIPGRFLNMMPSQQDAGRLVNDIYTAVDVGILIRTKTFEDGRIRRCLEQIGLFAREKEENRVHMLVDRGRIVDQKIPEKIMRGFHDVGITDPFERSMGMNREVT